MIKCQMQLDRGERQNIYGWVAKTIDKCSKTSTNSEELYPTLSTRQSVSTSPIHLWNINTKLEKSLLYMSDFLEEIMISPYHQATPMRN